MVFSQIKSKLVFFKQNFQMTKMYTYFLIFYVAMTFSENNYFNTKTKQGIFVASRGNKINFKKLLIDIFISNRQRTYLKLFQEVAKLGPIFVKPRCPSLVTVDFEIGL